MKILNVAVIGVGWIGRIHCECYRRLEPLFKDIRVVLHTVVDIVENAAKDAKLSYGFLNHTTDWKDVINNREIDIIDICVDNMFHKDIALAAAKAGKHIACEKPLATGVNDAAQMVDAAAKFQIKNMINFNYRKVPAIAYMKEMISNNAIGELYHIKGMFQQDFGFDSPMSWRFKKAQAGGGSIVTMGSHLIDLGRFLFGDYSEVSAIDATFIKNREDIKTRKLDTCDVDDALAFITKFKNGALGMFLTSWVSRGRKHHCELEVFGSKGSLFFNSERLNEIGLFIDSGSKQIDGIRNVLIGEGHPNGSLFALKTGMGIGIKESFMIQLYDFIIAITDNKKTTPDFSDGLAVEKVSSAVIQAAQERKWVSV